ncbi:MAG TPA: hypothetical protein VKI44_05445 [Acetobacteraceae bacterium]|nr:hypothetical protein [Acetobacteraceae bacterium]
MNDDLEASDLLIGNFVQPPPIADDDEPDGALPLQEEFWRPPVRFGSVPVEKEALGWDRVREPQPAKTP